MANTAIITGAQVGGNTVTTQNQPLKENIVTITITDEVVGHGMIRLIGSEYLRGAPSRVKVNLYKVTVEDLVTKKKTEYAVTRDAPVLNQKKSYEEEVIMRIKLHYPWYDPFDWFGPHYEEYEQKTGRILFNVINTAFEPKADDLFKVVPLEYPELTKLEAYALRTLDDKESLPAEIVNNPSAPRKNINFATGVMIHVGGEYQRINGERPFTGSFGCFGIYQPEQGNIGIKKFINDVVSRKGKIRVKIIKRNNVKWYFKVDINGNIV